VNQLILSDKYYVIVGGGLTGRSLARHLSKEGCRYIVFDSRLDESIRRNIQSIDKNIQVYLGTITSGVLAGAEEIFISPGVSLNSDFLNEAREYGVKISGDIDLFLRKNTLPVVGITGSNGKTTVTTMVSEVFALSGLNVAVGGNIGTPALELLNKQADVVILELSSFQLETISKANLNVACILNVSADHMDRYESMHDYFCSKQRVYFGAKNVVYNLEDPLTVPPMVSGVRRIGFSAKSNLEENETQYIYDLATATINRKKKRHQEVLFKRCDIRLPGLHNVKNVLALLAICDAMSVSYKFALEYVKEFSGLAHRCEPVKTLENVTFINDSKATNIGAASSAVLSLKDEYNQVFLIAGGDGKGADFEELAQEISQYVEVIFVFGRDAEKISYAMPDTVFCIHANSLLDATTKAYEQAKKTIGMNLVLLSPACASFDMFSGYEDRGNQFKSIVQELAA